MTETVIMGMARRDATGPAVVGKNTHQSQLPGS